MATLSLRRVSWLRPTLDLLWKTIASGLEDNIPRLGAALAFYGMLSIVPMLVLALYVASIVLGTDTAREQMYALTQKFTGTQEANTLQSLLDASALHSKTAFFNLAILFYGASGVFSQLQETLNCIWKVKSKSGGAVIRVLKEHFWSFTMVFLMGVLMIAAMLANTGLTILIKFTTGILPSFAALIQAGSFLVNLALLAGIFAVSFKIIPDAVIMWKDVLWGALLTAFLFTLGQYMIGSYLGHAGFIAGYGAAGSLVALLVWIYYSAQIFFFGAEFTYLYAQRYGSGRREDAS